MLYKTDFWKNGEVKKYNFEFDSRCPGSSYIPQIEAALESMNNSLLQQKDCTWAFLGDERELKEAKRYLFWTSLDTSKVGAGKQIPVLIQTGDGKYYVSETTTGERTKKSEPHKGEKYIAVSEQITSRIEYKKFLKADAQYSSLTEAYDAYVKALAKDEYKGVREKCSCPTDFCAVKRDHGFRPCVPVKSRYKSSYAWKQVLLWNRQVSLSFNHSLAFS